jgi:hypothetical protein
MASADHDVEPVRHSRTAMTDSIRRATPAPTADVANHLLGEPTTATAIVAFIDRISTGG